MAQTLYSRGNKSHTIEMKIKLIIAPMMTPLIPICFMM